MGNGGRRWFFGVGDDDDSEGREALDEALNETSARVNWSVLFTYFGLTWVKLTTRKQHSDANLALLAMLTARLGQQVSDVQDELRAIAPK